MASARVSADEKEREQLLDKLRKVVDGQPRVLQGTTKANAIFPGGAAGKKLADRAKREGYLETVSPPIPPKKGKAPEHARLTEEGRQFVITNDPLVQLLGELTPVVKDLSSKISSKTAGDAERLVQTACDELRQSFQKMLDKAVHSIEESLQKAVGVMEGGASPAEQLGRVLQTVTAALDRAHSDATVHVPSEGLATSERAEERKLPEKKPPPPPPETPLRDALREGYDNLKWMSDYQDGLVEIPHLLHEVRKKRPGLEVKEFHDALQELWDAREVDLHVLNEVDTAREPDQGIWQDGRLYYYVMWRDRP